MAQTLIKLSNITAQRNASACLPTETRNATLFPHMAVSSMDTALTRTSMTCTMDTGHTPNTPHTEHIQHACTAELLSRLIRVAKCLEHSCILNQCIHNQCILNQCILSQCILSQCILLWQLHAFRINSTCVATNLDTAQANTHAMHT